MACSGHGETRVEDCGVCRIGLRAQHTHFDYVQMFTTFLRTCLELFFDSRVYVFYTIDASTQKHDAENSCADIKIYDDPDIDLGQLKRVLPFLFGHPLYHRFKQRRAKLLCLEKEGVVAATGWIQTWHPFRRKFKHLAREATMLGPYWTHPEERGKGLYKKMLRCSLSCVSADIPILIYTSPQNLASQRGIESAGFRKLGVYRVRLIFRTLNSTTKL